MPDFRGGREIRPPHRKDQMRAVEFLEENLVLRRRCLNDELSCDGREFIGLQDLIFFLPRKFAKRMG